MSTLSTLNKKHRLFVEAYDGDAVMAMRVAGYTGTNTYLKAQGEQLLKQPLIIDAIKERAKYIATTKKAIADRQERQEMWTNIMRNEDPHHKEERDANGIPIPQGNIPLPIRLKASEYLGKSEADFVEKIDMKSNITITDLIAQSYEIDDEKSLEDIEAEYYLIQERKALLNKQTENDLNLDEPTLEDLI